MVCRGYFFRCFFETSFLGVSGAEGVEKLCISGVADVAEVL